MLFVWIMGCNYILIDREIIFDLDSSREMKTITPIHDLYVFIINGLIIVWHYGFVEIYDPHNMVFVKHNDTDLVFTDYNPLLNVLVTDKRECFRLENDNKYYFKKVVLGMNYIMDYNVVPQMLKI